ncbi:flagellar protein FlaF [Natrinema salaciae]|uniref:Flagellar protein FlaF n=1 Tax=Natrinema salaciae TaxID=1186196 RepID=A0A1H9M8R5_9EURY|nr:flagellar protein FlaF [Natrinema salaciae]
MIIFVGVLIAAGIAYPVFQTASENRSAAIDDRDDRALAMRNTAIDVAAWRYNESGNENFTMDVTNTGSTVLSIPETDLLIDGVYRQSYETSVGGSPVRELWQPGETLTVTISTDRPNRVKIVTEHGIAETITGV